MTRFNNLIHYGCLISFLLVFGFICFSLGSSKANSPFNFKNVAVIQEGNDNEDQEPSTTKPSTKILNDLVIKTEELEVENENLKKELEENKSKYQETDSQLEEIARLRAEVTHVTELKSAIEQLQRENDDLRRSCSEQEQNVAVIQEKNDSQDEDKNLETVLRYPQLPQTEDNIGVGELCPNTEKFTEVNEQRLAWVQSQCRDTLTDSVRSKISDITERLFYFPKSQLGWCPVFKAASSNVFAHFCHDYFDDETCKNKRVKEKGFKGGFRELDDFIEKDPPPIEEKRFLVVRDPFRRLLSLYRNKVELLSHPAYREIYVDFMVHHRPISGQPNGEKRSAAWKAISYAEGMTEGRRPRKPQGDNPYLYPPYPTFREIVDATLAGWRNVHLIPASQICGPCGSTKYDFLLKAETFDCDLKNMFNTTDNLRLLTNSERWMTNQTPAVNMTMFYSYYSTLSTEQLDSLNSFYEDDCLLFQYPCAEHVENIKQFKLLNPDFKHEYKNTWSGRVGDWDIIS
ncbi:uncharacterized protein LOC134811621 [Bolinopsis microptera]|uniref:uncharacterized protein LOC134811621 n=1 Tax=Bolinopsis microptera TaxID=2820187 RepID=UPI0030796CBB